MVTQDFNNTQTTLALARFDTHPGWADGHVNFLMEMDIFFAALADGLEGALDELSPGEKGDSTVLYNASSLPEESWVHFFSAAFRRMESEEGDRYDTVIEETKNLPAAENRRLGTQEMGIFFEVGETDYQTFSLDLEGGQYTPLEFYDYFFGLDGWKKLQEKIEKLEMTAQVMVRRDEKGGIELGIWFMTWEGNSIASKLELLREAGIEPASPNELECLSQISPEISGN
jgi:hypothetical protein